MVSVDFTSLDANGTSANICEKWNVRVQNCSENPFKKQTRFRSQTIQKRYFEDWINQK